MHRSARGKVLACVASVVLAVGATTPAQAAEPVLCNGAVATIVGTTGPDILRGTPGDDVIAGLGGPDVVSGLGGDDVVCGGSGPDVLRGNAGADLLIGDGGPDVAVGGTQPDSCTAEVARCENVGGPPSGIDLTLQLTSADPFYSPSTLDGYTYVVENITNVRPAGPIVVTDTLPAGIRLFSTSNQEFWDCQRVLPQPTPGRDTISCRYVSTKLLLDDSEFGIVVATELPTPTTVINSACVNTQATRIPPTTAVRSRRRSSRIRPHPARAAPEPLARGARVLRALAVIRPLGGSAFLDCAFQTRSFPDNGTCRTVRGCNERAGSWRRPQWWRLCWRSVWPGPGRFKRGSRCCATGWSRRSWAARGPTCCAARPATT